MATIGQDRSQQILVIDGMPFRLFDQPTQVPGAPRNGRAWQIEDVELADAKRQEERHLPIMSFHQGAGWTWADTNFGYEVGSGWATMAPGVAASYAPVDRTPAFPNPSGALPFFARFRRWVYAAYGNIITKLSVGHDGAITVVERFYAPLPVSGPMVSSDDFLLVPQGDSDPFLVLQAGNTADGRPRTVWRIQITGASSGTYRLEYAGLQSPDIAWDADEPTTLAALRQIPGWELVNIQNWTSGQYEVVLEAVGAHATGVAAQQNITVVNSTNGTVTASMIDASADGVDNWSLGPSGVDLLAIEGFAAWGEKFVGWKGNQVWTCASDPTVRNNWAPNTAQGIVVGGEDSIRAAAELDQVLYFAKQSSIWYLDEDLQARTALPDLGSVQSPSAGYYTALARGAIYAPYLAGLIYFDGQSYSVIYPGRPSSPETDLGWGMVRGVLGWGQYVFVAFENRLSGRGGVAVVDVDRNIHHLILGDEGEQFYGLILSSESAGEYSGLADFVSATLEGSGDDWQDYSALPSGDAYASGTMKRLVLRFSRDLPPGSVIRGISFSFEGWTQ